MAFARVVTAAARGSSGSSTSMLVRRSCHRSTAALSRCRRVVRRAGGSVLGRASYASLAGAEPDCRAVGEGALLVRFGSSIDLQVNERALACLAELDKGSALAGVTDVLPAYASVMVHFDPTVVPYSQVESWCLEAARSSASASADDSARTVTIPVRYGGEDGPDTDEVMRLTGLGSAEDVAQAHYNGEYRVYFLGFMGGFPYLGGLPDILAAVPRLGFPRQAVPKGAVGIAAGQTGVYTLCTPGGWHLLGQTSLELFDPTQDPPALLRAGDKIKFVPTDEPAPPESSGAEAEGSSSPPVGPPANPWVEVVAPGPLTSVQDIRRSGYSRHGVSPSGAADELALRMGNALVGNDEGDAGLEVTLGGLKLRCLEPCHVALTGADCGAKVKRLGRTAKIDVRVNEVQLLQRDDVLELGYAKDGARAYVCVEGGGVDVPVVLGSRSTDLRAGLGGFEGRALAPGDSVGRASGGPPTLDRVRSVHDPLRTGSSTATTSKTWELRVLPGPGDPGTEGAFDPKELQSLVDNQFDVLPRSDRMAVCLGLSEDSSGSANLPVGGQQMSEACVSGTIQLPPDGNPLILLAEHQTTGGYKVPGVVIQADLWQVGQMRPGDKLRFVPTTAQEATAALAERWELACETEAAEAVSMSPEDLNLVYLNSMAEVRKIAREWVDVHRPERKEVTEAQLPQAGAPGGTEPDSYALQLRTGNWIDLNADAGEGFDDAGLLQHVTSVNISCGGHVGSTESIARTVHLAAECGAAVGAHVSFVDSENFGRVRLDTPAQELRDQVLWQASALNGLCQGAGTDVRYIKPHGALYHAVMEGGEQAEAVFEAAQLLQLPLLLMPQSSNATFGEGFAERAYDGELLRPRDKPGALIHDPADAAAQAVALAAKPNLHSICVHGDSPNAVAIAKVVREALEAHDFVLRSFLP